MKGKTDRLELQLTARSRSATVARRTIADNEENEENEEHDEDAHLDGSVRYDLLVSADTPMQKLYGYGKIMCCAYAIGRFSPLFLRFSRGKCRNCPFFRAF